jgi:uncharacterized membrane protein (DUF485 family)
MQQPDSFPYEDPWYDELASGRCAGTLDPAEVRPVPDMPEPPPAPLRRNDHLDPSPGSRDAAYLAMHGSADFQRVRRRHRGFVLPASCAFLGCYLGYLGLVVGAPGLMAVRVGAGPLTVALLVGAGQFAVVALLTWGYVWHARLRRDPAVLELRWRTQQLTRSFPADGLADEALPADGRADGLADEALSANGAAAPAAAGWLRGTGR